MRMKRLRFASGRFLQRNVSTLACSACVAVQHLQYPYKDGKQFSTWEPVKSGDVVRGRLYVKTGEGNPCKTDVPYARSKNGGIIDRGGIGGREKIRLCPLVDMAQALRSD
jgi:hypothetical protein